MQKRVPLRLLAVFLTAIAIIAMLIYTPLQFTGLAIRSETTPLVVNKTYSHDDAFPLSVDSRILSLSIDGKIQGNGTVRIHLTTDEDRILVYASDANNAEGILGMTGWLTNTQNLQEETSGDIEVPGEPDQRDINESPSDPDLQDKTNELDETNVFDIEESDEALVQEIPVAEAVEELLSPDEGAAQNPDMILTNVNDTHEILNQTDVQPIKSSIPDAGELLDNKSRAEDSENDSKESAVNAQNQPRLQEILLDNECMDSCSLARYHIDNASLHIEIIGQAEVFIDHITLEIAADEKEQSRLASIPNIRIDAGMTHELDLSRHFSLDRPAKFRKISDTDRIDAAFSENMVEFIPDKGYSGNSTWMIEAATDKKTMQSNVFYIEVMGMPEDKSAGLTVHSYPVTGGNWTIGFNTIGTADLTIRGINGTILGGLSDEHDLELIDIKCGDGSVPFEIVTTDGDILPYEVYLLKMRINELEEKLKELQ